MRFWAWLLARLAIGLVLVGWVVSYVVPGGGEKEFQRSVEALKQVKSWRYSFVADPTPSRHAVGQGELSCLQRASHVSSHVVDTDQAAPFDLNQEVVTVNSVEYQKQPDGSWRQFGFALPAQSLGNVCARLEKGLDIESLPDMSGMLAHGVIEKGNKKTVDRVKCREWKVTVRAPFQGFEHRTVCLGVDDHLPREMTSDFAKSRWQFTNFNVPLQIEKPDVGVQQTSFNN